MEDDTLFVAGRQIESPRYASRDISRQGDVFMQTASEKNPHLPYGNNTIFTDFVVEHGIEQLARKGDEQSGLILNSVNKSVIVERKHFFPGMDDEYSPRQRTEHRPRTPKDPKKIITSVGSAAAGFSAIEIITHSELLSTGSALLSAGLVSGFRQVKRLRTRNEAQNKFDSIQKSFQNPEKRIRLANDTQVAVLSAESYEQLLSQKVPTKDYYGTEVAVKDVLEWAMSELKVGSLQIASKDDVFRSKLLEGMGVADFPTVTPELEVDGIVIQPDASIWQLFKVGLDRYNGLTFFNSDTTNQRITSYKGSVHLFAEKYDLELSHAPLNISRFGFNGEDEEYDKILEANQSDWVDSSFAVLHLPAGPILQQLLEIDPDPSELFSKVLRQTTAIAEHEAQIIEITESINDIVAAEKLSGLSTPQEKARHQELTTALSSHNQAIFMETLSVLAVAMTRDNAHEYDTVREELLDSISTTADSDMQRQAIKLFDAGIMALITNLPPDSDQAIDTGQKLKDYLIKASALLDSGDRYNQLYNGMRNRFPDLNLPEEI